MPLNLIWRTLLCTALQIFGLNASWRNSPSIPLWLHFIWKLTCALRRRVDSFEVLGHDQHCRLEAMGIPPERMALVRDPSPVQFTGNEHPLPVPAELKDRIALLYSGNWGIAHDVTFVEGYLRHHREGSGLVGLWLNAVGSGADQIEGRLPAHGLPVARTRPLPLADLPRLLVTPHAHLITLKG